MTSKPGLERRAIILESTGTHVWYVTRLKNCIMCFHLFLIYSFFTILITLIITLMIWSITLYLTFDLLFFFHSVTFGFYVHIQLNTLNHSLYEVLQVFLLFIM